MFVSGFYYFSLSPLVPTGSFSPAFEWDHSVEDRSGMALLREKTYLADIYKPYLMHDFLLLNTNVASAKS